MRLLKPALEVTISLIFEFNNPAPGVVINSGSYLLLLLSDGKSIAVGDKKKLLILYSCGFTATTRLLSVKLDSLDSPKS